MELVLSLFPGAGLLDRGFTLAGFCVVRGPDTLLGGDIREFHPAPNKFAGIIGGPPCQDFSRKRRRPPTGRGKEMLIEFARCVAQAAPTWWLLENVPSVPDMDMPGYVTQRLNIDAGECGLNQSRLRCFQFGSLDGVPIRPERSTQSHFGRASPTVMAKDTRTNFRRLCNLQGLPSSVTFPGLSRCRRMSLVGNGVPIPMAKAIAIAVRDRLLVNHSRLCLCGCGRSLDGPSRQQAATAACRKRLQRRRTTHMLPTPIATLTV